MKARPRTRKQLLHISILLRVHLISFWNAKMCNLHCPQRAVHWAALEYCRIPPHTCEVTLLWAKQKVHNTWDNTGAVLSREIPIWHHSDKQSFRVYSELSSFQAAKQSARRWMYLILLVVTQPNQISGRSSLSLLFLLCLALQCRNFSSAHSFCAVRVLPPADFASSYGRR